MLRFPIVAAIIKLTFGLILPIIHHPLVAVLDCDHVRAP